MNYFYLYQVTNLLNNKIYVGVHKTQDLNDGYMGSGKVINAAINKYGIDNFKKEILEYFDSEKQMFDREKEVVTEEFLSRKDVYNLRRGGTGGFDWINKKELNIGFGRNFTSKTSKQANKSRIHKFKTNIRFREQYKESMKLGQKNRYVSGFKGSFTKHRHTEKTKQKIGLANSKLTGRRNSQFGTMWITDGVKNKKIKKQELIPQGWDKGRITNMVECQ